METRILGKTGAKVSILTLGGCGPGYVSQEEANEAIKLAREHSINMIDIAPTYGKAEAWFTPWLERYRNDFFLAVKSLKRTKSSAWRQLNRSLKHLGTDYFDLYQFHAVSSIEELNQIFGENGAMEAFKEAKEMGLIKHIGITGHQDMRVLKKALESCNDFDTVLLPVYIAAMLHPDPINDFRPILKIAREKSLGVTAIKAIAKGRWTKKGPYLTWYEPLTEQRLIDQAVWFTLSQEGVTTYSLPCDVKLWPKVIDSAERFRKLSQEEEKEILHFAEKQDLKPLFPE